MDSAPTKVRQARLALLDRAQLFVVLVSQPTVPRNFRPNSAPQPLQSALIESFHLRHAGWITKLEPET